MKCALAQTAACVLFASVANAADIGEQLAALQAQNRTLHALVERQQEQIDVLRGRLDSLAAETPAPTSVDRAAPALPTRGGGRLIVSGEFGLSYFGGSADAQYANHEFRVDDSNVYLEAELARGLYAFGELQLSRREALDEAFKIGELYLEWENPFGGLLPEGAATVRFGRVDTPFGEEYLVRTPLKNPLITHSLGDVWGTDEGLVLFGAGGRFDYALAVQNGGQQLMRDFDSDKALAVRLGFEAGRGLRFSASALRTGELNVANEPLSETWIGNNVFRSIGSGATTHYEGSLWQLDARYAWRDGHVLGAFGGARYDDNDPLADNAVAFTMYHLEAMQSLGGGFYGAMRYSRLRARDGGYPLAGLGNFNKYFLGSILTEDLWRLGAGVGYRFNASALLKLELTREERTLSGGAEAPAVNQLSAQAALGF